MTPDQLNAVMREQSLVTWLAWNHHRTNKDETIDFVHFPFLRQIFLDDSPYMVIKKCSQVGISEYLNICTYAELIKGRSIFYAFPNKSLVYRFVNNRFNQSYIYTKYYQQLHKEMVSDNANKTSSLSMFKLGKGTVIFVSAFTAASFIEFPADDFFGDEIDRSNQENLNKGLSRLSASKHKMIKMVSNPTIEAYGIDEAYTKTNQYKWHLKCGCGNEFIPNFFLHVVRDVGEGNYLIRDTDYEPHQGRDIRLICDKCSRPVDRYYEGRWIDIYPTRDRHGYDIDKQWASTDTMVELVDRFSDGLTNDNKLQDFYNFDLGLAFTAAGAKITELMLDQCIAPYSMPKGLAEGLCIAGIDVNYPDFNIVILRVTNEDKLRAVYIDTIRDYKSLKSLLREFKVRCGIIDAGPERRISAMLCARIPGMFRCDYTTGIAKDKIDLQLHRLTTNRTMALDNVKEAVLTKRIELPANARSIEGFYSQMTASTRVYDPKARHGEGDYRWVEGSKADHYCFSAGTMIITESGEKEIENIRIGERVLTRKGFKIVLNAGRTGIKKTYEYYIDGTKIKSTDNHSVWTKKGLKNISTLTPSDMCCTISFEGRMICQMIIQSRLFIKELCLEDIPNQKEEQIEYITRRIQNILNRVSDDFILKYGKTTTVQYRKDSLFIIKMIIHLIMNLIISCLKKEENIRENTWKDGKERIMIKLLNILIRYAHYKKVGIQAKRDTNFINNMLKILDSVLKNGIEYVRIVIKNIKAVERQVNFVLAVANKKQEGNRESITYKDDVQNVGNHSLQTKMKKLDFVVDTVRQSTIAESVFNLEVEDQHEYFANGILVSNCHAMAYALVAKKLLAMLANK